MQYIDFFFNKLDLLQKGQILFLIALPFKWKILIQKKMQGVDKRYKYLYSYFELSSLSLTNFPYLPFLIFAGAIITTATIGLPVFTS